MGSSPQRVGPYEIRGTIGAGGMGVVYLAWDPRLKRRVALKTLRPELARDDEARRRFLREARAVAAISHPNVTQIYDIGQHDDVIYFAMEYLDGKSLLDELRDNGPLPVERAISLMRQAVKGLQAAVEQDIIHRDVKPSNLVLNGDGTLKVTDFGLAKQNVAGPDLTSSTVFIGTADYLSPERACGEAIDLRSDIYSLGATLYELLTGRKPFEGATPIAVITKHVREPVPPPRELRPELTYPVQFLILRMMAKQRENRPQNYEILLGLLDRLLEDRPLAAGSSPAVPEAPPEPEAATPWGVRIVSGAAIVLVLVMVVTQLRPEADTPGPAATPPEAVPGSEGLAPLNAARGGAPQIPPRRARKAQLSILRNSSEVTPEGSLRVFGEVQNSGEGTAVQARVRVTLVDEMGTEIASREVDLIPSVLAPDTLSSFETVLPGEAQEGTIKLEVSWVS